jgi:hypothetical protein
MATLAVRGTSISLWLQLRLIPPKLLGPPACPVDELVMRFSGTNIADEMREEHRRRVLGE